MIEFEFLGAAQTVTGSKHLLRTSRAAVLLDCGLFQGHRSEAFHRNHEFSIDTTRLDAVVLSHAHIDHSGALPILYKKGYRGPVYATPATCDLCSPMLQDAAMIQEADSRHIEHLIEAGEVDIQRAEPLYTLEDVNGLLSQMKPVPLHQPKVIAPGISLTFLEAGHVLGSAMVVLDVEDEGKKMRVAFSGDLGRPHLPILRDPEIPEGVNCLLMESTYGDRLHDPIEKMTNALGEAVNRTIARGGKVIVPSFALERAQEVIFALKSLKKYGKLPAVPVYVDSPLTVKLTDVFKRHPECYDPATLKLLQSGDSPFDFEGLKYVSDAEESKAIDEESRPSIIISASGMCEAGRVLHHLRSAIGDQKNTVLIVGFQAQHTLGRRLVEHQRKVRIFGVLRELLAEVVVLNGFSAHADQKGLAQYALDVQRKGKLKQIILVHGEPEPQKVLSDLLKANGVGAAINAPGLGERVRL